MLHKSTTGPLLIYGTRHGTLYNLTPSNFPSSIPGVQLNYGDLHDHVEALSALPAGLKVKKFLGLPEESLTYLSPYNFSQPDCMTGCHYNTKVKIKSNKGYTEITAPLYDRMVELIEPDYFVGLTEYPSLMKNHHETLNPQLVKQGQQGKKKQHSNKMDEEPKQQEQKQKPQQKQVGQKISEQSKSEHLEAQKQPEVVAEKQELAKGVANGQAEKEDPLNQHSNKSSKRAICKTKSYLELSTFTNNQETDKHSGPKRLATVHGGCNLSLVNRSLEQVLDHAIDGIVLCGLCEGESLPKREEVFDLVNKRLEQEYTRENSYFANKKLELVLAGLGKIEDIEHAMGFGYSIFEVNYPFHLAEKQLALVWNSQSNTYEPKEPVKKPELKPLQEGCDCYACANHSEAYIAHLIECFELTAKVLLSIHNIHVYEKWLLKQKQ